MSMIGEFAAVTAEQFEQMLEDPDSVADILCSDEDSSQLAARMNIDKAWQGIHYLLTGNPDFGGQPPFALVVLAGTEIGDDVGYGPARYLTPREVVEIAGLLASLPRAELASRYSAQALTKAGIYPNIWDREEEDGLGYLLHHYDALVEFYRNAAKQGHAVFKWIS
jgi:hypothetical protein